MNPRWFFTEVADPNASAFLKEHDDIRLAINAIMTLDAAFGSLHAHLRAANDPATAAHATDDSYKETFAAVSEPYRVLRDTAYALKHGELTGKKSRLVSKPDQAQSQAVVLDNFILDHDEIGGSTVMIDISAQAPYRCGRCSQNGS